MPRSSAGLESEVTINTPRQPNVRPSIAPFLDHRRNADSDSRAPTSSFVAPFTPGSSPTAVETSGNVTGNRSANDPVTRGPLIESLPIPLATNVSSTLERGYQG